jgi:cardiolipin synthase
VALFNSPTWYSLEEVNYRTHRKILVVDGEVGFTGGAGVDDQWKGNARSKEEWRDTQIEVRGPMARLMEGAFYENFVETAGVVAPVLDDPLPPRDAEGASFLVRSSPTGGSNDLKRLYLLAIASATRSLDITTPYFVPDESTLWSLHDAVGRGVRVRILVESDITDAMPVKYASRHYYDRLLADGIEIYEYTPTMMHTKVLVVDGIWSMFGSANFDNRSLELNDELNVAVSSRDLASRLLDDMEQDLEVSHRLELAAWRDRSLLMKSRELFWSAFGEVF